MSTAATQRQPELTGQTVVVTGGRAGIGPERLPGGPPERTGRVMVTAAGPAVR